MRRRKETREGGWDRAGVRRWEAPGRGDMEECTAMSSSLGAK